MAGDENPGTFGWTRRARKNPFVMALALAIALVIYMALAGVPVCPERQRYELGQPIYVGNGIVVHPFAHCE